MTKKGKKDCWQTFENPPPVGEWVDVYCENPNETWRIDLGEWTGTSLGSINNPWNELGTMPILWRHRHPIPLSTSVNNARRLPVVPIESDEWISSRSIIYDCFEDDSNEPI